MLENIASFFVIPLMTMIAWFIAIISFISSWYMYFKGKKKKELLLRIVDSHLISDTLKSIENLKIFHNDSEVSELYFLHLQYKNTGDILYNKDIAKKIHQV